MDETSISQPWVDIIPPAAAEGGAMVALLGVVFAVAAAALVLYLQRQPRRRALRGLRRLQRQARRSPAVPREGCRQVLRHLRSALAVSRLESVACARERQAEWLAYVARLKRYCFAAAPPSPAQLFDAAQQAGEWLRRGPLARGEPRR